MTSPRYESYRHATALIDVLDERLARPNTAEILRESAEGLLLSREPSPESDDLFETAAVVLVQLIASGAISRSMADRMLDALRGSGPDAPVAVGAEAGGSGCRV
jgi:hypothetical protein